MPMRPVSIDQSKYTRVLKLVLYLFLRVRLCECGDRRSGAVAARGFERIEGDWAP